MTLIERYKSHLNVMKKEGVFNDRIEMSLNSIKDYKQKLKLCRGLLAKKDLLIRFYYQNQKEFQFNIDCYIKQIDVLDLNKLCKKPRVLKKKKSKIHSKKIMKEKKLKKHNIKQKKKEKDNKPGSVRVIYTPMYS